MASFDSAFRRDISPETGGWSEASSTVRHTVSALTRGSRGMWIGIASQGIDGIRLQATAFARKWNLISRISTALWRTAATLITSVKGVVVDTARGRMLCTLHGSDESLKDQVVIEISKWDGIGNPLYRAAQYGHTECVKLLLEAKADPNKWDKEGRTAAYLAAMHPSCSAQYVNK